MKVKLIKNEIKYNDECQLFFVRNNLVLFM